MATTSKIFMGIDVSKATLDISVGGEHFKISNKEDSLKSFINDKLVDLDIELSVLESTGGYERLALRVLNESGIKVHRAHPNKVYAFAKACGHFAKTDKLDSKLLEKYAKFIKHEKLVYTEVDTVSIELQALRSVERNLETELHAEQCRLDHISGRALWYVKKQIEFIKKQLSLIQKDIYQLIYENKALREKHIILTSYKGVGKKIANSLLCDLPELGTLSNKEAASLVGVAPKTNESGKKISASHISGGRFFVRKVLYMAALVSAFSNQKMKKKYTELLEKGKAAKVALTAIMRKIIVCLNAMIKNNKPYIA